MSIDGVKVVEENEEVSLCRVCHCEGYEKNHLYFPCKCDGSIKYVHDACLLQWLKVKGQRLDEAKCELCGERFHFKNVYLNGSPDGIPQIGYYEFFIEATSHLLLSVQFRRVFMVTVLPTMVGLLRLFISAIDTKRLIVEGYFRLDPTYNPEPVNGTFTLIALQIYNILRTGIHGGFGLMAWIFLLVVVYSAFDWMKEVSFTSNIYSYEYNLISVHFV